VLEGGIEIGEVEKGRSKDGARLQGDIYINPIASCFCGRVTWKRAVTRSELF